MKISKPYDKKLHEEANFQDHYAKLDDEGNLYQLVMGEISQKPTTCVLYKNNDHQHKITEKINKIINDLKTLEY